MFQVKEFHPDVCKDLKDADTIIRRVIQAYEVVCSMHDCLVVYLFFIKRSIRRNYNSRSRHKRVEVRPIHHPSSATEVYGITYELILQY